jgi:CHAD domain-containing protein
MAALANNEEQVKPGKSGRAVIGYLDEQVETLRDQMPRALHGDDAKAVHRTRVATRRLKAGLGLLRPVLENKRRKKFATVGRDLRRRLGALRDLDVMLDRLGKLTDAQQKRHGEAASWVIGELRQEREDVVKSLAGGVRRDHLLEAIGKWWGLRQEALDTASAVPDLLAESAHRQLDAFAAEADMTAGLKPPPEGEMLDVHQVRITAKGLRYTLEQADAAGVKLTPAIHASFKRMQDDLGSWHDHVVLSERCLRVMLAVELPLHRAELASGVLDLSRLFLTQGGRDLERFRKHWRAGGGKLQAAIRDAFPLTQQAPPPAERATEAA